MKTISKLLYKEIKDFASNTYGVGVLVLFLILAFGFLWILPVSSYTAYGIATPELYFQFISYLFLIIVPLITIGNIGKEYRYGTLELMRSRGVSWSEIIISKLSLVLLVVLIVMVISSVHLWVVNDLSQNYALNTTQIIGSYLGLLLVCGVYAGVSLAIGTWLQNSTISILLSITICFTLYNGISLLSESEIWSYSTSNVLNSLSLEHHVGQISRGVLRLSSLVYMATLICGLVLLSIFSLNRKDW